jgi:hypothetical protein
MRLVGALVFFCVLVLGSINVARASGTPEDVFMQYCWQYARCDSGHLDYWVDQDADGAYLVTIEWYAGAARHGTLRPVNLDPPAGWTCKYIRNGVIHRLANYVRIRKATYISCTWRTTEPLPQYMFEQILPVQ